VDIKTKGYVAKLLLGRVLERVIQENVEPKVILLQVLWVIAACFMADYLAMTFTQGNIKDCLKIIKLV
jgi:hypothetical protein